MDNNAKLRPLYLAKILYERTDEDHYLTTMQLAQILEEEYGIPAHRQTIKTDIELLQQFGMDIQEVKSTQNRYNLISRQFEAADRCCAVLQVHLKRTQRADGLQDCHAGRTA